MVVSEETGAAGFGCASARPVMRATVPLSHMTTNAPLPEGVTHVCVRGVLIEKRKSAF